MKATRLTLICHARTVAQKMARFPIDESLEMEWQSAKGSRCAQFKGTPRLICAPERRAWQTAQLFGDDSEVCAALADCDLGRWQGLRIDDLQTSEPDHLATWLQDPYSAPHGGESVAQLRQRVVAWLKTLETTPGHVVAITHPFVIRAALTHVLNSDAFNLIDVEPLSATDVWFSGRWRLRLSGINAEGAP
ncbi:MULTISPECIES: histidine phosphatase family protein [unclassified Pseudomonas]|uniref:histidine phosphatase family protein n=1 Tax=unclassified Pseudomonas TaxID=196821 RepID=UPI002AC9A1EB|nr:MULTISPECIES: histidine phosphatase family protein [unclassified Pseudomonas]MEB0045887.1 histidine phosphatase family protein [Pseudomonas sp. Dout3]MEB0097147.1 histidine phosphatase family protein [Pseudomonas sp. DC1.2]WPX56916.1 histidine phosphatase family protein [Pseudomonas sp. DC1.2]